MGGFELVTGGVGAGESLVSQCAACLVSEEGMRRTPRHHHSVKDRQA